MIRAMSKHRQIRKEQNFRKLKFSVPADCKKSQKIQKNNTKPKFDMQIEDSIEILIKIF